MKATGTRAEFCFQRKAKLLIGGLSLIPAGVVAAGLLLSGSLAAQNTWPTCANSAGICYTGGYIGIGTMYPGQALTVAGTLGVGGNAIFWGTPGTSLLRLWETTGNNIIDMEMNTNGKMTWKRWDGLTQYTFDTSTGALGIGTTTPCTTNTFAGCIMSVNGGIQAKEVVVNTGWSDYVFAPGYTLPPLSEIASYIREHHHLPGIPTEAQVKEKGVSLGEIDAKLLAKIEELTLHMINAEEKNNRLEQQNLEMRDRIVQLERTTGVAQLAQRPNR